MSDFKVKKSKFESAVQKIVQSSKDFNAAMVRTAAVNKKFVTSIGGVWMAAEVETAGSLEIEERAMDTAMDTLKGKFKEAGSEIDGTLTSSRDSVFSSVGASASVPDQICLRESYNVPGKCDQVKSSEDQLKSKSDSIKSDVSSVPAEYTSGITSALDALNTACDDQKDQIQKLSEAFTKHKTAVQQFDSKYAGQLDPSQFMTDEMQQKAISDTSANIGTGNWLKTGRKLAKNYLSVFGEMCQGGYIGDFIKKGQGFGGNVKNFYATFHKKFGESTWGIANHDNLIKQIRSGNFSLKNYVGSVVDGIKKQHVNNWKDMFVEYVTDDGKIKGGGLRGKNVANSITELKTIAALKRGTGAGSTGDKALLKYIKSHAKELPVGRFGSGLKALGRNLGYVGDVMDAVDTVGKASKAFNDAGGGWNGVKAGAGQVIKGVVKFGVGKAIGAAIGTCFGGPAGAVVGMAIGGVVSSWADRGIDWAFSKFAGVKTY